MRSRARLRDACCSPIRAMRKRLSCSSAIAHIDNCRHREDRNCASGWRASVRKAMSGAKASTSRAASIWACWGSPESRVKARASWPPCDAAAKARRSNRCCRGCSNARIDVQAMDLNPLHDALIGRRDSRAARGISRSCRRTRSRRCRRWVSWKVCCRIRRASQSKTIRRRGVRRCSGFRLSTMAYGACRTTMVPNA